MDLSTENPFRLSAGITYRRKQVWISELTGILMVAVILIGVAVCGVAIILKDLSIRGNNRRIAALSADKFTLSSSLNRLRELELIHSTLTEFGKGRLSRQTISYLVDHVEQNSRTYGYDPLLVLAVIHVESLFRFNALGQYRSGNFSGAIGLMQVKFETAREVAKSLGITLETQSDLLVPEINIAIGLAYLTRLIAQFNNLKLGILAYNQGPGIVLEYLAGKRPLSQEYYQKIIKSYFSLQEMHQRRLETAAGKS